MLTKTPSPTDPHIIDFCRRIAADAKPILLPISEEPGAMPLDCFFNVRRKVEDCGGKLVFGWSIWEWPNVFVEAEHHAVYETPDGKLWIDITPTPLGYTSDASRLFIQDSSAEYDFQNEGTRRSNIRYAIKRDPLIQEFFRSAEDLDDAMDALPGVGEIQVSETTARRISSLENQKAQAYVRLAMKYYSRNDPCFCRSGRKFKKCHGQ